METIQKLPKAELYAHIEGAMSAELMHELASRNGMRLASRKVSELRAWYTQRGLMESLTVYHESLATLCTHDDFRDLALHYVEYAKRHNIRIAQLAISPQLHMRRGVSFAAMLDGLLEGFQTAEDSLTVKLCLDIQRDLPVQDALEVLTESAPYINAFCGLSMSGSQIGYDCTQFEPIFERAHLYGLRCMVEAGTEAAPSDILHALGSLHPSQINNALHAADDERVLRYLALAHMPVTLSPLALEHKGDIHCIDDMPLYSFLDAQVSLAMCSIAPELYGSLTENYLALHQLGLSLNDIAELAVSAFDLLCDDDLEFMHYQRAVRDWQAEHTHSSLMPVTETLNEFRI
ncbi:adenosine deaminase family protein [Bifidobacterium dolichotidis]|nr:hypothetical protein [Bifidobacterium dolichotidis]